MDEEAGAATPPPSCYSPTQNLDQAYEERAEGCECAVDAQSVCIEGSALICEHGRWQAVEDGPCAIELDCDGRLQDIGVCLHYFQTCVLMSTGTHCGIGDRTDECEGEIVDGEGDCYLDDAYCTELDSGAYCTG